MSGGAYKQLEDRTTMFAIQVIRFCRSVGEKHLSTSIVNQIIRSASSVGANYREANEAKSHKEKLYFLYIVKRELKETQYWLDVLEEFENPTIDSQRKNLRKEVTELLNIFMSIIFSFQKKK